LNVYRCLEATRDIHTLRKKHRQILGPIENFERILAGGRTDGHNRWNGLKLLRNDVPASIWKARVIVPQLGGASSGLRYVYERFTVADQECAIGLIVYLHQQGSKEHEIRERVRERSKSIEATAAALRDLELCAASP
jgi:hypothetical protein